jgi:ketosteroid isomerase-like protein
MKRAALALSLAVLAGPAAAQQIPTEVVDAFHSALTRQDTAGALSLLARDLIVFEFGLVDPTLEAYAFQHLPLDMNFAAATTWTLQTRRMGGSGDDRWVLSTYRVTGTDANGAPIDSTYLESILLTRSGGNFRINHIHWSQPTGATPTGAVQGGAPAAGAAPAPAPAPVAPPAAVPPAPAP